MLVVKILIIIFFVLLAVLLIYGLHNLIETERDNRTVARYNAKMDKIRKERIEEEKEKQRRIRGESEDAPKYAAGGDMDRIKRWR